MFKEEEQLMQRSWGGGKFDLPRTERRPVAGAHMVSISVHLKMFGAGLSRQGRVKTP